MVAAFDAVVAGIAEIAQPIDALVASVASPPPPTSARVDSPEHILPAYVDINDDICWPPEVSAGSSPAAVADVTLEPDNSDGDWTFGSSPYPRKCSLICLQGHNEMEPSVPEGIG